MIGNSLDPDPKALNMYAVFLMFSLLDVILLLWICLDQLCEITKYCQHLWDTHNVSSIKQKRTDIV